MKRTIWWEDNQVKMIDQRILPLHYEILAYDDHIAVAEAIRDMAVRGAPAIGAAGGFGMALAALRAGRLTVMVCWLTWRRPKPCSTRRGPPRSISVGQRRG